MGRGGLTIMVAALALLACSRAANDNAPSNLPQPAPAAANEAAPVIPPPETGPDARTPLSEPKGTIDPKSTEAAGQIGQHYGALIEQKRWSEANALWNDSPAAAQFAAKLMANRETHLEIGQLGDPEGAAGSIYVTQPVTFYGKDQNGADFRKPANVILRRVNDVPGSTEAQRRWHIERIEWRG